MTLEIVHGEPRDIISTKKLIESLSGLSLHGTVYIGYPILASADETMTVDALLIDKNMGLVIFHLPSAEDVKTYKASGGLDKLKDTQDKLYFAVENNLGRHRNLRKGRELAVNINVISFIHEEIQVPNQYKEVLICTQKDISEIFKQCNPTESEYIPSLNAAIQRVTTIKPVKKRENIKKTDSRGAILKIIEKEIANLDRWQKQAAIETPDGPQRVRGLAGSGKTIVLALKAAYLHTRHPDWNITVTFHTRSLYQQFRDLIRRFTFEHSNDEPDWGKINILHSWGSRSHPGLYAEFANAIDYPVRDFLYGKEKFGRNVAFDGICTELLQSARNREDISPLFEAVLIDEAQDLPNSFFKLVYIFLTEKKRVIWAYDELQNLTDYSMISANELFGTDLSGKPIISLENPKNEPQQDIILPICYRNTPWALTLAHALGFGIYREEGLVQHFDDNSLWREIGYEIIAGQFKDNSKVTLQRESTSYPEYFDTYLSSNDAVSMNCFEYFNDEVSWIAEQVKLNLTKDELDHEDILIILPNSLTAKSKAKIIMEALKIRGLDSHLAGVSSSVDEIFVPKSIAIANIHRAKGNEAPMVYVANCDYCASGIELIKLRNSLFTAITRSRAWVRLTGSGEEMQKLETEYNKLKSNNFQLIFTLPNDQERKRLRTIHRDQTLPEKAKMKKVFNSLREMLEMIEKGELFLDSLPVDVKNNLRKLKLIEDQDNDLETN